MQQRAHRPRPRRDEAPADFDSGAAERLQRRGGESGAGADAYKNMFKALRASGIKYSMA